ncbi:MAG: hypothetical protein M0Z99_34760 [Betaproteobacteria bacterium]|nr:hypothetical protein [Betaproteobacteria bacterium]
MNDEDKKAVTQAQIDKRADAIRAEADTKADAARAADARPTISEKDPAPDADRTQLDKPEPEPRRELPRQAFNDHRSPSYGGQGISHNIDMQRATNPAAYLQEKREALEKKAPDLKRAAENLKQPAPRPETEAGKAWQAEKLRNPETSTAWHLGAASVKNGLDNSPNALAREEHKMRLEADPVYKNGYENAQRWEAERELRHQGAGFAKLEHEAAKTGAKLPDAAIEQHKERMVSEPEYRDAYTQAAAPLHAERQAEAAAAREQKQAEAATAQVVERVQVQEHDNGLAVGVGLGIN